MSAAFDGSSPAWAGALVLVLAGALVVRAQSGRGEARGEAGEGRRDLVALSVAGGAVALLAGHVVVLAGGWLAASVAARVRDRSQPARAAWAVLADGVAVAVLVAAGLDTGTGELAWAGGAPPPAWAPALLVGAVAARAVLVGSREPVVLAIGVLVVTRLAAAEVVAPAVVAVGVVVAVGLAWRLAPVEAVAVGALASWGAVEASLAAALLAAAVLPLVVGPLVREAGGAGLVSVVAALAAAPAVVAGLRLPLDRPEVDALVAGLVAVLALVVAGAGREERPPRSAGGREASPRPGHLPAVLAAVALAAIAVPLLAPGAWADVSGAAGEPLAAASAVRRDLLAAVAVAAGLTAGAWGLAALLARPERR